MKRKGSVTIFLALMLSVISAFVFVLVSSVRTCVAKCESASATDLAIRSCFAEYNRELFDRFHILLIDSSYKGEENGIDRVAGHFSTYLKSSISGSELMNMNVTSGQDEPDANMDYMYRSAVCYAKKKLTADTGLSEENDEAYFITYLLDVFGNATDPSEGSSRDGELEYILYGFEDDEENIRLAVADHEENEDISYEDYLISRLEDEGSILLRRRFADLVSEYLRQNGSPGFDLDTCYFNLGFEADFRCGTLGDYSITRKYAYDNAKM